MARSLNSMLMGFSRVETFVTAFIAKIDLKAGRATYCSAGHPSDHGHQARVDAARWRRGPWGEVELLGCQSGVIGAFESMVYETGVFTFAPGDMLFMYTDGTIEARDRTGAFFGEQRLRDLLLSVSGEGVSGILRQRSWASLTDLPNRRWTMTLHWCPLSFTGSFIDDAGRVESVRLGNRMHQVGFWGTMVV